MLFKSALVLAYVAMASAATVLKTEYFASTDCSGDEFQTIFRFGETDVNGTFTKFTESACDALVPSTSCRDQTSISFKTSCVSAEENVAGTVKVTTFSFDSVDSQGKQECASKSGQVESTAYVTRSCVNNANNVENTIPGTTDKFKSSKITQCTESSDSYQTSYYADADCSGSPTVVSSDVENNEQACQSVSCVNCFVSTAAYGSMTHESVSALRAFRDNTMLNNGLLAAVYSMYDQYGPMAADAIVESNFARAVVRAALWPAVSLL